MSTRLKAKNVVSFLGNCPTETSCSFSSEKSFQVIQPLPVVLLLLHGNQLAARIRTSKTDTINDRWIRQTNPNGVFRRPSTHGYIVDALGNNWLSARHFCILAATSGDDSPVITRFSPANDKRVITFGGEQLL